MDWAWAISSRFHLAWPSARPNQSDTASARVVIATGSAILTLPLLLGGLADWVGLWSAYGIVLPLLAVAAGLVLGTREQT